jgi:integrase
MPMTGAKIMTNLPVRAPLLWKQDDNFDIEDLRRSLREVVSDTIRANHAESTLKNYRYFFSVFESFCHIFGYDPYPATEQAILEFLAAYGNGRSPGTLRNAYSAIRYHQMVAGLPYGHAFKVQQFLAGHRNRHEYSKRERAPFSTGIILDICTWLDASGGIRAIRDKAIVLMAYAGAFRASELVAIDERFLKIDHRGVKVLIPRSKTDQGGKGHSLPIARTTNPATCPVVALEEWLHCLKSQRAAQGISGQQDCLFPALRAIGDPALNGTRVESRRLTTDAYRRLLKNLCKDIGLNPCEYSTHSFRSGHATTAAQNGVSVFDIAAQGRWKTLQMVMLYVKQANAFDNSSSNFLGL